MMRGQASTKFFYLELPDLNHNHMQLYINFWCNFGSKHVWIRVILVKNYFNTDRYFEKHVKFLKNPEHWAGFIGPAFIWIRNWHSHL